MVSISKDKLVLMVDALVYFHNLPCRKSEKCKSCEHSVICFHLNMIAGSISEMWEHKNKCVSFIEYIDKLKDTGA